MFELVLDLTATWVVLLMVAAAVALARAADAARRLVFMDLSVMLLVCTLVITSVRRNESHFLDAALALSLLSFVGTVAIASYAARRPEGD